MNPSELHARVATKMFPNLKRNDFVWPVNKGARDRGRMAIYVETFEGSALANPIKITRSISTRFNVDNADRQNAIFKETGRRELRSPSYYRSKVEEIDSVCANTVRVRSYSRGTPIDPDTFEVELLAEHTEYLSHLALSGSAEYDDTYAASLALRNVKSKVAFVGAQLADNGDLMRILVMLYADRAPFLKPCLCTIRNVWDNAWKPVNLYTDE